MPKENDTQISDTLQFLTIRKVEGSHKGAFRKLQGIGLWFLRILTLQNDVRHGDRHYLCFLPDKLSPKREQHIE